MHSHSSTLETNQQPNTENKGKRFSRVISYLFHPILYPLIGTVIYLFTTPRYTSKKTKLLLLTIVFVGTYVLPIILLAFLKGMGLIKSFHLKGLEERKFPILFFSFLAILVGRLFLQIQVVNDLALFFISGGLSFLVIYGFLWLQIKVSIHTLGLGGLIGFLLNLSLAFHYNFLYAIASLFLLFGVIAKARIELKAHVFSEIIWGITIGIVLQLLIPFLYQNI